MKTRALAAALATILLTGVTVGADGPKENAEPTFVKSYYVGDFVAVPRVGQDPNPKPDIDYLPMIKLIKTTTAHGTWKKDEAAEDESGGSITPFFLSLSLMIRQTDEGHKEVQNLLRGLRDLPPLRRPAKEVR